MNTVFNPDRLRAARGARPLEEVALAAGVTTQTIRNWEAGRTEPTASQLGAIAKLYVKPFDYFFVKTRAAS